VIFVAEHQHRFRALNATKSDVLPFENQLEPLVESILADSRIRAAVSGKGDASLLRSYGEKIGF
jgi:hypothetical protein